MKLMEAKPQLLGLSESEIYEQFFEKIGEPRFRARQVVKGLRGRRVRSFADLSDLPLELRRGLEAKALASTLTVDSSYKSEDGTRRYLMRTASGDPVETVFIPSEGRDTICFSSQSGCALGCDFCLTARLGLLKNLTAGEIVEQIIVVLNDVYGPDAETPHGTNLVAMGEGEPFANFENVVKATTILGEKDGLFIVPKRITVSTVGIVPKIYEFAGLSNRPRLAISLSAPDDELRSKLMPVNQRWNIEELMKAAKAYEETLGKGESFTFEYVLLGGVNDSPEQAKRLARLIRKSGLQKAKVNLIPHNPAERLPYVASAKETIEEFRKALVSEGIPAYIRTPRGRDIYAACGQLAAKDLKSGEAA